MKPKVYVACSDRASRAVPAWVLDMYCRDLARPEGVCPLCGRHWSRGTQDGTE